MTDIPALEALIADPASATSAETTLLASVLYVLPAEGTQVSETEPLKLSGVVLKNGARATAAFTRPELAELVFRAPASHGMRGLHLLEASIGGWIAVNPGQDKGLILDSEAISRVLASAGSASPMPEFSEAEVTSPDPIPAAMVTALKAALADAPVQAAWLGRSRDSAGQTGWRIELRGALAPAEGRDLVASALADFDLGGEAVDLVTAGDSGPDAPGFRLI